MLASGNSALKEIVADADILLKYLNSWQLWRIAGKPFQLRAGGLLDQVEEEFDAIYRIEGEFQKICKASGQEGLI